MIPSQLPLNLRKSNYTQGILLQYLALEVTGNWIFGYIFHLLDTTQNQIYVNIKICFTFGKKFTIIDKRQILRLAGK